MGKTGHLPRIERAARRGSSEVVAEEHGGRGEANALRKGAGNASPLHACARSAPQACRPGLLTAHPTPTVRTLEEEEPRGPTPPGLESRRESLEVAGRHLFLSWGFGKQRTGTRFPPHALAPLPHEERGGRSWASQGESAPGFPAHFNSVSASKARRFTPPGAPQPSAGTRSASPTHLSPGMESGNSDLSLSASGSAATFYPFGVPTRTAPGS